MQAMEKSIDNMRILKTVMGSAVFDMKEAVKKLDLDIESKLVMQQNKEGPQGRKGRPGFDGEPGPDGAPGICKSVHMFCVVSLLCAWTSVSMMYVGMWISASVIRARSTCLHALTCLRTRRDKNGLGGVFLSCMCICVDVVYECEGLCMRNPCCNA